MTHPELYADGKNGLGQLRDIVVKFAEYNRSRLTNKLKQFRCHAEWIFHQRSVKDKVSYCFIQLLIRFVIHVLHHLVGCSAMCDSCDKDAARLSNDGRATDQSHEDGACQDGTVIAVSHGDDQGHVGVDGTPGSRLHDDD